MNQQVCVFLFVITILFQSPVTVAGNSVSIPLVPTPQSPDIPTHVVAGYMPFWGIRPYQPWGDINQHASFYPILGTYRSDDPYIYNWHVYWAKSAGIDTFMFDIGWFSPDSSITDAIDTVLNEATYSDDIRFTFNYFTSRAWWEKDSNPGLNVTKYIMDDFETIAQRFFTRDNLITIDGMPIIFMVSDWDYDDPILADAVNGVREVFQEELGLEVIILLDYVWPGGYNQITDNGVFNGVYKLGELAFVWEHYGWGDMDTSYDEMYYYNYITSYNYSSYDLSGNLTFTPCLMPGFNNTYLVDSGENSNLLIVDRNESLFETGVHQFLNYVDPSLDILYLHTWNDFQEGTSIEPTVEYGFDFLNALYVGLTESEDIPEFYTPESYAMEIVELVRNSIEQNQTIVSSRNLELASSYLSQAEANLTAGDFKDATLLAIKAYDLMNEPTPFPSQILIIAIIVSIVGIASVSIVTVKYRR